MHNKTLSFCPGAILDGKRQPVVEGAGEVISPLCTSTLLCIANPRVFYTAMHKESDSTKEFGLHTFPKPILQQLEATHGAV